MVAHTQTSRVLVQEQSSSGATKQNKITHLLLKKCWMFREAATGNLSVCVNVCLYVWIDIFLMNIKTNWTPSFPPQCPPRHSPSSLLTEPPSLSRSFQHFSLVRPLVLVELGVVIGLAVLHSDTARQDGSHIVADRLPLCLLLSLLLHLPQLDTWRGGGGDLGGGMEGGRM